MNKEPQYYFLLSPEQGEDLPDIALVPILWNDLDESIFNYISEKYLDNVYSTNKDGEIEQVSIVYAELSNSSYITPDSKIFSINNSDTDYLIVNI